MMKILYFHQHFSTPDGATGTRSYEMARRLVDRGHEVTVVCGSAGRGNTGLSGLFRRGMRHGCVDGINVIELNLPYSNKDNFFLRTIIFLRFALRSVFIALSRKSDLIFATSTPLTAGIPGIVAKCLKRTPFVFEVRDLWPELPREMGVIKNPIILKLMAWLEWSSYHLADRCIGLSPGIVDGIQRKGIPSDRVTMIPNGCDLDLFSPLLKTKGRPAGVEPADLMAIFSGAHGVANGLDAVLDVASILQKKSREDIKFVFVGDGKLKPSLIKRVQTEHLSNCFFMDPIPKKQLSQLQKDADVGLMILANVPAFYYGTSPNKFYDYIASGLPVVNNYPGWIADLIKENNCGIAVPPDDPNSFAQAMEHLADHRDFLEKMSVSSRKLAEAQFDRDVLAKRFVDWLEGTISN
jgi:glycosyltransferase involved in cell wall biosynthesis